MSIKLESNTLKALTERSISTYKDKLLFSNISDKEVTYAEAGEKISLLHDVFESLGIKKGDKVSLCSENMPNWGVVYLAITSMGAVVVPILADFHMNEIHHIIKHSESVALFVSKRMASKLKEDDFSSSLQFVFSLETLDLVEGSDQQKFDIAAKGSDKKTTTKSKGFLFKNKKIEDGDEEVCEDDLASIIYTSGTTGQSKGVMLTHKNLISQIFQITHVMNIHKEDKFLSILPLAHTYECSAGFLLPFLQGASIYYVNKVPSPKVILSAVEIVKPTCLLCVPLVIEKIYKARVQTEFNKNRVIKFIYENIPFIRKKLNKIAGKKLHKSLGGNLRLFGIGGSKLSPFVESFLIEAEFPYAIGYGLTETAPIIAAAVPGNTKVGTTGVILPEIEYRFNKEAEESRDGELHVRGPNVMNGYYKDVERTKEVLDDEGWLNTGDLGYIDENGIVTINGRSKNVIIGPSGENIYPEAIESVINRHPIVLDSLVYESAYKVVAKIHIDYDQFDELYNINNTSDLAVHSDILSLLEDIRIEVNSQLSNYSKIALVFEQSEPFVKTPTKKIKRYLYIS